MIDSEPTVPSEPRKTVDLCGHERERARCTRERDPEGPHECPFWKGGQRVTWE